MIHSSNVETILYYIVINICLHLNCWVCTYVYTHLYVRMCLNMHTHPHDACIHIYTHTQYSNIYVHTYVRTHMHVYTYILCTCSLHAYIHTYVHTYIHTYVRTHIHVHTYLCAFNIVCICIVRGQHDVLLENNYQTLENTNPSTISLIACVINLHSSLAGGCSTTSGADRSVSTVNSSTLEPSIRYARLAKLLFTICKKINIYIGMYVQILSYIISFLL